MRVYDVGVVFIMSTDKRDFSILYSIIVFSFEILTGFKVLKIE